MNYWSFSEASILLVTTATTRISKVLQTVNTLCHLRSRRHVHPSLDGNWTTTGPSAKLTCAYLSTFADASRLFGNNFTISPSNIWASKFETVKVRKNTVDWHVYRSIDKRKKTTTSEIHIKYMYSTETHTYTFITCTVHMMYPYSFTSAGHTLSKCSSILSLLVDKTWEYAEHYLFTI